MPTLPSLPPSTPHSPISTTDPKTTNSWAQPAVIGAISIGFLVLVIFLLGIYGWLKSEQAEAAKHPHNNGSNNNGQPVLTVDNAPLDRIGGMMVRTWGGQDTHYPIIRVRSLTPTSFSIECASSSGTILAEYDRAQNNGKGRWEDRREVGAFTAHPINGNTTRPTQWAGRMADDLDMTKHVDDYFIQFEVKR